ncbi:MAG TPA: alpha/beta hydrolase [Polyangia bacterium]|nr:alpha/beta hydrolase [Polyangia bacterium]
MKWFALAAFVLLGCGPQRLDSFLYDPLKAPAGGYQLSTAVIPRNEEHFVDVEPGVTVHIVIAPSFGLSGATGAHAEVTMLYFHGQSNDIGTTWPRIELLYPLGVNLVAIDPRGYGKSTGTPSEPGIHADVQAVWDYLRDDLHLDATRFVIYGRSLGAAFATDLASARTPAALVTESAFTSIADMVRDGAYVDLPPGFVADSRWDNLAKIARMPAPYLAFHGLADDYVRYQYSQELTAAHAAAFPTATTTLVLVPGANHGDAHGPPPTLGQAAYLDDLRTFLRAADARLGF